MRRGYDRDIPSDEEHIFKLDLKRAFAEVEVGLPKPAVHDGATAREGVEIVTRTDAQGLLQIETFLGWASKEPANGIDYETNCLRPYAKGSKILSAAVSMGNKTLAFPFDHPQANWSKEHRVRLSDIWHRYLALAKARKVVHNLSFEQEWTAVKFDPTLLRKGRWEDTASQAAILDERRGKTKPGCFFLEFLVQQYFGFNIKQLSGLDRANLEKVDLPQLLTYNGLDATYHLLLYQKQTERLVEEKLTEPYELAVRRVPTAVLSQRKGVPVHQPTIKKLQGKYETRLDDALEEIAGVEIVKRFGREKGHAFNPQSNPDIFHVFWNMLKRPECRVVDKYSKKSKISCDEDVLIKIDHPLATSLLKLRKVVKRKSTYIDPLVAGFEGSLIYPDGLSHAQFNTYFVETGRISCELPNWQQWPKREEEARELRLILQAEKGDVILAIDYGQIEGRVAAMFTRDKKYCDMLWKKYDIHQDWTERLAYAYPARILGKKFLKDKKALKTFRTDVKNQFTFPLIYGAKMESAAAYLNIPVHIFRPVFNQFWKEFEGIAAWQERNLAFYRKYGYTECLTGRRRRGPLSVNKIHNTPIQGTAAEIVMEGWCVLSETQDPDLQPELNIHDDLTFLRVPENRLDEVAEKILDVLLDPPFSWINVPISVELSVAKNWLEMQDMGPFYSTEWKK
jgi:DNA polymerase-1